MKISNINLAFIKILFIMMTEVSGIPLNFVPEASAPRTSYPGLGPGSVWEKAKLHKIFNLSVP